MRSRSIASNCPLLFALQLFLLAVGGISGDAPAAPAETGPPYRVAGEVTRPEKLSGANPVYTEEARQAQIVGVVMLEAVIDEHGSVTQIEILKGLPMGLDQVALEAVRSWKFKPATLRGRPVPVYYTITVNFRTEAKARPLCGPLAGEFLGKNPEFAKYLRRGRIKKAAEFVDRWAAERPADPDLDLARVLLPLAQGRLSEALSLVLASGGRERYEVLCLVGALAARILDDDKTLSDAQRAQVIELGLQAQTAAMAANPDEVEAVLAKRSLLLLKAASAPSREEQRSLYTQVSELENLARELGAKSRAAKP
jgi:TonB family protein